MMEDKNNRFSIQLFYVFFITLVIFVAGVIWLKTQYHYYHYEEEWAMSNIYNNHFLKSIEKLEASEKQLKSMIENSQSKVVTLEVIKEDGEFYGSGFLYNLKGDIVTNAHVVEGAKEVTIKLTNNQEYEGIVIGIGKSVDIAIVRVKDLAGIEPLKVSRMYQGEVGNEVVALGSPLGLENTVTIGIISGLERDFVINEFNYIDMYQISAPISPGSSGGPLLDRNTGQVIGINSAKINSETIGFSIPINTVLPILENWSKHPFGIINSTPEEAPPSYE